MNLRNGGSILTELDGKGNFESTETDPKGNVVRKTTSRKVTPTGMTLIQTSNAEGKLLFTTIGTQAKNGRRTFVTRNEKGQLVGKRVYNSKGEIVSQTDKMKTLTTGTSGTSGTGKGGKKVYLGEGSQKHKETLHEDKLKGKEKEEVTTSESSSRSHHSGKH